MNLQDHHEVAPKPAHRRGWRHVHRSPLFRIGLLLCLAAIAIYVLTEDLAWRPKIH
jgi:hypothetical protein